MQRFLLPVLATLLATSMGAQAQQIGEYTGLTDDGSTVTIDVAQDPGNSNLEVTLVAFGLSLPCSKSGETLHDIGIGINNGADIIGGKFSFNTANFFDIDLVTSMTFKGTTTVKGKVGANLAAFNPALTHDKLTKNVQVCVSPVQNFTATFTGAPKLAIAP
ncbi:MAG: hypothetical protein JO261_05455, partial [Alphaproteobacteria bacterium]|nr:hypothetical protein [Alphaproteobacteria bacterium]